MTAQDLVLKITDLQGRGIVTLLDNKVSVGKNMVIWKKSIIGHGIYLAKLSVDGRRQYQKFMR